MPLYLPPEPPEPGEIVFLNSGSPPLTVSQRILEDHVTVRWITAEGEPRELTANWRCFRAPPPDSGAA